jgi:PAS domain S-box-containing protein
MEERLKILFLEDDISDVELIWREIQKNGITYEKLMVDNKNDYLDGLKKFKPDVIIADYTLPHFDGMTAIKLRNEFTPLTIFILVTGSMNDEIAVECMKAGADDYIIKNNLSRLGSAIVGSLQKSRLLKEKIAAEAALLESLSFSESLLRTIPFGMDIVDETGTVLFQSENFQRLFGKEALGKKCWELYRMDKKKCSDCPLTKGIKIGETATYESDGVLGNRFFEISHTGMLFQGKMSILEIFHDITERKEKEKELIRSKEKAEESDRLKTAFLTNMSHEIRTPMNGILGFAELLKEPNLSIEEQQEFIQTIQISGARMLNTLNDIIDLSKIEAGLIKVNIRETNINEKMDFTYCFFGPKAESRGLKFFMHKGLPPEECIINTDNEKVYAVLTNLIKNALKFTYDGSIEFGYEKKGQYLEFYVKDTGIGIPRNQQELIFDRFRQGNESFDRKYEGNGLGLSISKSYAEMLGGKIWVESEESYGSIFYFTIPYNISEKNSDSEIVADADFNFGQLRKLKILIVEDDEISYSLLRRILLNISGEVLHAVTGIQAIEACRNNPDLDLVLMDIRMPFMDGYEATRRIRQFNRDVIIIAQTAYADSADRERALNSGCNNYISKPNNATTLYELIREHCK